MSIMLKKAAVLKAEAIVDHGYDPIVTFASQIEKVESRIKIEEIVRNLTEESEANKYKIGGALARIQANENWWQEAGYQNFKDYVEGSLGIRYRKAMYLIEIYKKLLLLGIPYTAFDGIGWSKINRIVSVLTKENLGGWIEKAKVMSRSELEIHIKAEKAKLAGTPVEAQAEPKTLFNESVKLHADQRQLWLDGIEKAKEETGSESKGAAVEAIFQHYMGGGIAFSDWDQALVYFFKHCDQTEFAIKVISRVEELCTKLVINVDIGNKPTESTSEGTADAA